MTTPPPPIVRISRAVWRDGTLRETSERATPAETPIALVYDGGTQAVMMASPADVEDFAVGFSLTEGIVGDASEIESLEIVDQGVGLEARMWLAKDLGRSLSARRRSLAGPTGCGLCGIDSLEQAVKPARRVTADAVFTATDVHEALEALSRAQALNFATRAVHGAGFYRPGQGLVAAREDVGRHNALDKLAGHLARSGENAATGFVALTSRVSVEMIQKASVIGVGLVVAVSAPTALGVAMAEEAGITLAAIARGDGFEVFTHPHRIVADRAPESAVRLS
ncbi:formate dehydrogenase accessory sulfurtransferase FdhD [Methylopila sp. Yamaguchi]|uniref:formate dehydrogenase accessory sulfurtransferase FdhD n=1 Tax=Methylopila sp. Yamaguchi TaxID=1437817 RepID=UPI000CC2839C|nr:formate dehydrogenase accessory sulfurtransferase FdhD [Methylopila sp. Yamaguchi]GBD48987.1 formate dehydrogenase family accessory protein FdhD [Methylopila sp. Yamaguchi]